MRRSSVAKKYDLVVLGGGPAGYPAAIRAAQLGAAVCLIEKGPLGGTCLNWGCIPTKTLHGLAHLLEQAGKGNRLGVDGSIRPEAESLFAHKREVVSSLVGGIERLLKKRKIDLVRGVGRLAGSGSIEVEGVGPIEGKAFILATGSSEVELPGLEFDGERILNSTDILDLGRIPESLIVVGGGVIGCEFASIFNALGSRVTIVEMLPSVIATEDGQVTRFLQAIFKKKGIDLRLGTKVKEAMASDAGVSCTLETGDAIEAELLLVSVGRRPNIGGLGLEELEVETSAGGIGVNDRMETSVERVYAAGDVVGGMLLAHVATREGIVAAENALGGSSRVEYGAMPSTIYTLPEVSRVGITEEQAKERGLEILTGRFPFAANGKAKGLGEEEGFVKWVTSKGDGRLLGLHIIGPQATELLAAGIIAVERGMTADEFGAAVFPHPTLSESLAEAVEAIHGRSIHLQ
jgi:dihydrolipoamide dehydrogenase